MAYQWRILSFGIKDGVDVIAFIEKGSAKLLLMCDTETAEELSSYKTFAELMAVCMPGLTPMENPDTLAPIYSYNDKVWWFPNYLTCDPLEVIRDNLSILLEPV